MNICGQMRERIVFSRGNVCGMKRGGNKERNFYVGRVGKQTMRNQKMDRGGRSRKNKT